MTHFLQILANVRIGAAEIGGTLALIFIIAYGTCKAWNDFVAPLFRKTPQRNLQAVARRRGGR